MKYVSVVLLLSMLLAAPSPAMASCVFALSAQSAGDVIHITNAGAADTVSFSIRDDAGVSHAGQDRGQRVSGQLFLIE